MIKVELFTGKIFSLKSIEKELEVRLNELVKNGKKILFVTKDQYNYTIVYEDL
jgi:hypothetical protein